jgi:hypothetical protein
MNVVVDQSGQQSSALYIDEVVIFESAEITPGLDRLNGPAFQKDDLVLDETLIDSIFQDVRSGQMVILDSKRVKNEDLTPMSLSVS